MQSRALGTRPAARATTGSYNVALPLYDFADAIAVDDDVALAYMTAQDFQLHLDGVINSDTNTRRNQMLKAIFNNSNATFADPIYGDLTIRRLANTDSTTYPPILGAEAGADDEHYIETNYTEANISDTNNPFVTAVNELEEHFGEPIGGSNILAFVPASAENEIEALTDFREVGDRFVALGDDADIPERLPTAPGRMIGRMVGRGACWVSRWRWIPDNYMFFVHLGEDAPLMERIDEAGTGLPAGLSLVANDGTAPVEEWFWRDRFGYGVTNRLNGVMIENNTGGTYTIPTGYS